MAAVIARLLPLALLLTGCSLNRGDDAANTAVAASVTPEPGSLDAPDVGAIRVDDDVLRSGRSLTDWPATGFNIAGQRFSPLTQITPDSVRSLQVAWAAPLTGEDDGPLPGAVATPVVSGEVLYATGSGGWVRAFDVRSGELLWRSDATRTAVDAVAEQVTGEAPPAAPAGLALWKGRVFVARPGGELASIDAKTGRTLWSHSVGGEDERITSAPVVAGNIVYLGVAIGGRVGERGAVVALDYAEGRERWRFYTVPPGGSEPDGAASDAALAQVRATWSTGPAATLPGVAPTEAGAPGSVAIGGGLVGALAFDAAHGRLIVGTGRPAGAARAAGGGAGVVSDRLFSRSLLALDATTGEFAWHRLLPGTAGVDRPLTLAQLPGGGGPVAVALALTGLGDQAVVSLADGALLGWRPLPAATARVAEATGQRVPPPPLSLADAAYSPDAGLWLIPGLPSGGAGARLPSLAALNPATGGRAWTVRQAGTGGGLLATAGGLVFQGSDAGRLTAYALADGRPVWSAPFGGPIATAPSSFLVSGRQTIAVVVDGRGGAPARLVLLRPDTPAAVAAAQQRP